MFQGFQAAREPQPLLDIAGDLRDRLIALLVDRPRQLMCLIVVAAAVVGGAESPAPAQQHQPATELQFEIPSQALASALKDYIAVTGLELFYESTLTDGRRSLHLSGRFTPEAALRRLLRGTGLDVASFEPGTITILPAPETTRRDHAAIKSKVAEFGPYFALIQEALRSSFCRSLQIRTDPSELIVRLWIAASGAVSRAELLSSTGSENRDGAYAAALRALQIGEPPPRAMPQPVTLMVLPRMSAAECRQLGASNSG